MAPTWAGPGLLQSQVHFRDKKFGIFRFTEGEFMLKLEFETVIENEIRLNENVLHENEIVVHSNETEVRWYENVFHKNEKNSHMNEVGFQPYEIVLHQNEIEYSV